MARTSPTAGVVSRVDKSDRSMLAEALADGRREIQLNIASAAGRNGEVAASVQRLGGRIWFREDAVDYLSVVVPRERTEEASRLDGIEVASLNMGTMRTLSWSGEQTPLAAGRLRRRVLQPPSAATPRENPYLPTRDIGAPQFIAAHPTFDGRGVTIGVVDMGIDLQVPELETATTIDGRPTRKIVDWLYGSGPLDRLLPVTHPGNELASLGHPFVDSTWVSMAHEVTAPGGVVEHGGIEYIAPSRGRFRIGVFDEREPGSFIMLSRPGLSNQFLRGDVNRDGNPSGSSGLFGVLWNESTNEVWVDTNQNHSFADERALTDYVVRFDVGVLGTDDPATSERESVPFVIQTDREAKFVGVGITNGPHGTMVAGTAAGRGYFKGAFDGVAPGAALVSVMLNPNVDNHGIIEALIKACRHPAVDLVTLATGSIAGLETDRAVSDVVVNRLVDHYRKPIIVAAMNSGSGMDTVAHPSIATKALSVGAYVGKGTWLANLGATVGADDSLAWLSARGPRGDGAVKPDIVAPTNGVTAASATFPGLSRPQTYALPPGYLVGSGTSQATPFAAGAAALLISAARQTGIAVDPERIALALKNGARFLPAYAAYEQGSGLVQVGPSWEALKGLASVDSARSGRHRVATRRGPAPLRRTR